MSQTHDLAEWARFLSLGVGVHAAFSVPYFLFVDSDSARDFDPRPAVRRALAADARQYTALSLRDAALTVAALLALLLPVSGGTR